MEKIESKLTVFFSDPFWVGVYEVVSGGKLEVSKITFGTEPKDYEIYGFILENLYELEFSPPVKAELNQNLRMNPKRMQRAVKKQVKSKGIETKSQQALRLQQEEHKTEKKHKNKEQREEKKQYKFEMRQQKRKEKHRGR